MFRFGSISGGFKTALILIAMALMICMATSVVQAQEDQGLTITLPDGQTVPLDGLSGDEAKTVTRYMQKVAESQRAAANMKAETAAVVAETLADPDKLNSWRELITGTIKDICTDLNVSVNEFIKTPAGAGVAALIIYKVAGKELLGSVMDVVLIVPFWFVIMIVLFFLQRKYLSSKVIYERKKDISPKDSDKPKWEYFDPKHTTSYPWNSNEARCTFACVLYGSMAVVTLVALIIVF